MAKKRKPQQSKSTAKAAEESIVEEVTATEAAVEETIEEVAAEIEDAVEITDDPVPSDDTADRSEAEDPSNVETPDKAAETDENKAEEPSPEEFFAKSDPTPEDDTFDEPVPEHTDSAVIAPQHQDSASNSVLLPALLGGLIAAAIGFGVAYYLIPRADPGLNESVATNTSDVAAIREEVAALAAAETSVDLTPLTEEIGAVRDQVTENVATINDQIAAFDERLITLEKQPSGDGTLQEAAVQAYQRELDELRAQVEEQAGAALAQLESTRAEAEAIEQAALDAARAASVRAALAQVQTGLSNGEPMEAALTELEEALGEPVPAALSAVAEGAPTLAGLQAAFPDAARAALADARAGGESGEEATAFGAFLREQLNVRSVAPRDGDDADAVLSRAQAAVSEGKLQAALDEIGALPDVAKAKLAEWATIAETRVAALNAADDISLSLNVN